MLDASPRILRLAFTELDPLKICDFGRCGVPNAADFRVRVDTLRWELGIIDIPPHETVVYTANETGKVYLELLNYTVTYQEKVFVSYTPFPDNACEPTAGSDPNRVCKLTYPDDTACGGRTSRAPPAHVSPVLRPRGAEEPPRGWGCSTVPIP